MTKTELESKHLADLHQLAAAAGLERYRMLPRPERIGRPTDGEEGDSAPRAGSNGGDKERGERPRRRRSRSGSGSKSGGGREREERGDVEDEEEEAPAGRDGPSRAAAPASSKDAEEAGDEKDSDEDERPRRRRRRRRPFGRRREGISIQDLLLPAESGRQAGLVAGNREGAAGPLGSGPPRPPGA